MTLGRSVFVKRVCDELVVGSDTACTTLVGILTAGDSMTPTRFCAGKSLRVGPYAFSIRTEDG